MMSQSDKQLLEMAKDKLRWYTLEASDEEFDAEAVDALVNLVSALEAKIQNPVLQNTKVQNVKPEAESAVLKRFREHCGMRLEEEQAAENKDFKEGRKIIIAFPGKRPAAVITAACLLVLIVIFSSWGMVNADEDQGFFHWLRRDESGTKVLIVPNDMGFGVGNVTIYDDMEAVPESERKHLPETEAFLSLQEYELKHIQSWNFDVSQRISKKFVAKSGKEIFIEVGVVVYKEEIAVSWEQFDEYEFQHSEMIGEYKQDIFLQEKNDGKQEYMIVFYGGNKKYFVMGNCELEKLKEISEEYINSVLR